MAELHADFRPIRIEEVAGIARRLRWRMEQDAGRPYFYRFHYEGDDVPLLDGKPRAFLVYNEKHTGNLMVEQIQITAAMYRCELLRGALDGAEPFGMRKFLHKINELDRTLRAELPFYKAEIELRRK